MREFLQVFAFLISFGIVVISIYHVHVSKQKKLYWFNFTVYGLVGCIFYVTILLHYPNIHEYSTMVRAIQSSLILGNLIGILLGRRK